MCFLGSSWRGHGNLGNTLNLCLGGLLLCCLTFETWQLPKREREGDEGERMDGYFCVASNQKNLVPKHSRYDHCCDPNGRGVMSPGLLLLRITVI
jgi:hypothetical protein